MKKILGVLITITLLCSSVKSQCPPGTSATESVYSFCSQGCGVLLLNWPQGVLVDIFGGSPMHVITETTISGKYNPSSNATGNAFICVPCNVPLTFASVVPGTTSGCVITNVNVLPVTLNNFSVEQSQESALLKWDISLEQGVVSYIVERSNDGKTFKDISTIEGSRNSVITKNYSYTDASTGAGTLYYKVKIVQENGGISYSPVKSITNQSGLEVKVFPNPITGNSFTVSLPGNLLPASVSIFDALGRSIYETKTNQTTLTIHALSASGMYVLKIVGKDNSVVIQKIIKR